MEGESGIYPSIVNELHSSDIQGNQMESASGVPRSIFDELHSWDIHRDEREGEKMVLLEVTSMKLIPIL